MMYTGCITACPGSGPQGLVRWATENPEWAQLLYWRVVPSFEPSSATLAPASRTWLSCAPNSRRLYAGRSCVPRRTATTPCPLDGPAQRRHQPTDGQRAGCLLRGRTRTQPPPARAGWPRIASRRRPRRPCPSRRGRPGTPLSTGMSVFVSALFPSNRCTADGNPPGSRSRPTVTWGRPLSTWTTRPCAARLPSGLEMERREVIEHRPEPPGRCCMRVTGDGELVPVVALEDRWRLFFTVEIDGVHTPTSSSTRSVSILEVGLRSGPARAA